MFFGPWAMLRPFFSKGSHERTSSLEGIQDAETGVDRRQDLHYHQFVRQRHHSRCGAFRRRGGRRLAGSRDEPRRRAVRVLRGPRDGMGPPPPHRERQKADGLHIGDAQPRSRMRKMQPVERRKRLARMDHGAGAIVPRQPRGAEPRGKDIPNSKVRRKVPAGQA